MNTVVSKSILQTVPRTGNWRSSCIRTHVSFAGGGSLSVVEMTIPDDWRHQGLDIVFGFGNCDAVGAALQHRKKGEAYRIKQ